MTVAHATFTEHLTRVLRNITHNRQTGLLSVEFVGKQDIEKGEIFFEGGETVFARTEQEWGETALARIMNWSEVYYSFFEGVQLPVQHRSLFDLHTNSNIPESHQIYEDDFIQPRQKTQLTAALLPLPAPPQALWQKQPAQSRGYAEDGIKTPPLTTSATEGASSKQALPHSSGENKPQQPASYSKQEARQQDLKELSLISWEAAPLNTPTHQPLYNMLAQQDQTSDYSQAYVRPDNPQRSSDLNEISQHGLYAIFCVEHEATMPYIMKQMDRRDRMIFMLLDGKRTIPEIARLVHRSETDIGHTLVRLLKKRYIKRQETVEKRL